MSVSHRFLRRTVLSLLYMLPGICAAQTNQFLNIPAVQLTNGRVSSFLTGAFQSPPSFTDMLWINTPVVSGTSTSVTVGEELNQGGSGFDNHGQNEIIFTKVAHVVAALADFDGDGNLDYAFALTPTVAGTTNLCVYYGTGATALSGESSYSGPIGSPANAYPPSRRQEWLHDVSGFGNQPAVLLPDRGVSLQSRLRAAGTDDRRQRQQSSLHIQRQRCDRLRAACCRASR